MNQDEIRAQAEKVIPYKQPMDFVKREFYIAGAMWGWLQATTEGKEKDSKPQMPGDAHAQNPWITMPTEEGFYLQIYEKTGSPEVQCINTNRDGELYYTCRYGQNHLISRSNDLWQKIILGS